MSNNMIEECDGFLVKLPADSASRFAAVGQEPTRLTCKGADLKLTPLFDREEDDGERLGLTNATGYEWKLARPVGGGAIENAWDIVHELVQANLGLAAAGAAPLIIEPDFTQRWPATRGGPPEEGLASWGGKERGAFEDQRDYDRPGTVVEGEFAWHLGENYAQLGQARQEAAPKDNKHVVRIAHIDTGYDADHSTFPKDKIEWDLQRSFIDGSSQREKRDAHDRDRGGIGRMPGHGTGTLSILAGVEFSPRGTPYDFTGVLGAAPDARIVPLRVGNSVVQIKTSSLARGLKYVCKLCANPATRVDVISMSMGGVASRAWAEQVNRLYELGVVYVAAAGNHFAGLTPRYMVYPARFHRVTAACGVMANGQPYFDLPFSEMQGCWGPRSRMKTAIAAFTPNIPWAEMGAEDIVDMDGAGTSAATPQVAGAAALYLQKYGPRLRHPGLYPHAWMRVEAVRHSLFAAALKDGDLEKLGRGILRARDALQHAPPESYELEPSPEDSASFSFLRTIFGFGIQESHLDQMLELEATQLTMRHSSGDSPFPIERIDADPDASPAGMSDRDRLQIVDALLACHGKSAKLTERLNEVRNALPHRRTVHPVPEGPSDDSGPSTAGEPPAPTPAEDQASASTSPPRFAPPAPPHRLLRTYALDPSLRGSLQTAAISEALVAAPYETVSPGPRGEYVEVIDVDPSNGCCYEPIDLEHPHVLAQNGLSPSEGTPQFHQQMAYAVTMSTIDHFERALGRKVLWRAGPSPDGRNEKDDSNFVRRLRIYPHALRQANAFYSPDKIALMFGYFNAPDTQDGTHLPGGRVFTCLSHDIVAHETTHALLDGMYSHFLMPTNPDVRAFHEAFADIVALFRHFTLPALLRHEIAATRGEIRTTASLFGKLAVEFGRSRGAGALRSAIGTIKDGAWVPHKRVPGAYKAVTSPHERGTHLVAAVFDAFLSIYERRTADLLRLATGGSGILDKGAIHPDLVNRLSDETAKAARHVLSMCIRALDYCPPTDITFGDYLRALITADHDLLKNDAMDYRVAFVEAFRQRGMYPDDLRTLGVESLLWRQPHEAVAPRPKLLEALLCRLRRYETAHHDSADRKALFKLQRSMRLMIHRYLSDHFANHEDGRADATFLGLHVPGEDDDDQSFSFEVHTARIAHRASPDGSVEPRLLISLLQSKRVPFSDSGGDATMRFEGGCTIVAELRTPRVLYCVYKRIASQKRLTQQREFAPLLHDGLAETYLGAGPLHVHGAEAEPFARLHEAAEEGRTC